MWLPLAGASLRHGNSQLQKPQGKISSPFRGNMQKPEWIGLSEQGGGWQKCIGAHIALQMMVKCKILFSPSVERMP